MMDRCVVCGNVGEKTFRVIAADGSSHVFDNFECAIQTLAPRCSHCAYRIIGHVVERGSAIFCSDHCAREASSDAAERATTASFRVSGPTVFPTSTRAFEAKTSAPGQGLSTFVESAAD